jgi:hypothetical protein
MRRGLALLVAATSLAACASATTSVGHARAAARLDRALAADFDAALMSRAIRESALAGEYDVAAAKAVAWSARMQPANLALPLEALGDAEALRGDVPAAVAAYERAASADPGC